MRARTIGLACLLTAALPMTVGAGLAGPAGARSGPVTGSAAASAALSRFAAQKLDWHTCRSGPGDEVGLFLDSAGARCATVTVPLDYARPDAGTITLAVARAAATDPAHRQGVLFINPGGPGTSAIDMLAGMLARYPQLAGSFDVIGMDPRFVGRSTPIDCGLPARPEASSAGASHRSFEQSAAYMAGVAERCGSRYRRFLPYASTLNTARDMDLVRAVLGARKLNYFGVSYGTYLGAVYLQLFGEHADRVVLDSSDSPEAYGPDLMHPLGAGMERALRHWADWTAGEDDTYRLGRSGTQVLATLARVQQIATRRPLLIGSTRLDGRQFPAILDSALRQDTVPAYAALAQTVQVLQAAAAGHPVTPTALLQAYLEQDAASSASASAATSILCGDKTASRDPQAYWRNLQRHRGSEPFFAPYAWNITPCAYWPIQPREPLPTIDSGHPALLLSAADDPVTPYPEAQSLHRHLGGSRLVTLLGAYRHGVFTTGSDCVDQITRTYLATGTLPERDLQCPAIGSPQPVS